ncbi:hypothetical protein GCM10007977_012960 [Dactylosporangium sucinum]|uniref:Uncharacterized protein n=1 Tax=Dactylosporangium sucinum TaxID=1424081 RepID=A0A917T848_9ACTN|nr:hypothetical protein GCM10007977_012960 [Dactylosporangium sucinum]
MLFTVNALMLIRRVPAGRDAVTRRVLAEWKNSPLDEPALEWWELVDPAGEDDQPPGALAAVRLDGDSVRLVFFATPPGRRDRAVQLLIALVDALRSTSARTLVAAPPAADSDIPGILREAGFQPVANGLEAVDL